MLLGRQNINIWAFQVYPVMQWILKDCTENERCDCILWYALDTRGDMLCAMHSTVHTMACTVHWIWEVTMQSAACARQAEYPHDQLAPSCGQSKLHSVHSILLCCTRWNETEVILDCSVHCRIIIVWNRRVKALLGNVQQCASYMQ